MPHSISTFVRGEKNIHVLRATLKFTNFSTTVRSSANGGAINFYEFIGERWPNNDSDDVLKQRKRC